MDEDLTQPKRRRLTAQGMMLRRRRIFARLREGWSYDEIAGQEDLSAARIRQIVSEFLQRRAIDNNADHAKLQLERLAPAMQLAAEGIAAGAFSAINPYLKVLDRLDRYQTVVGAHEGYDDEARKRLMEKVNRLVENLRANQTNEAESLAPETQETQEAQETNPAEDAKKWFESPASL